MGLGIYPEVGLLEARRRAFVNRELLHSETPIDPQAKKQGDKDINYSAASDRVVYHEAHCKRVRPSRAYKLNSQPTF